MQVCKCKWKSWESCLMRLLCVSADATLCKDIFLLWVWIRNTQTYILKGLCWEKKKCRAEFAFKSRSAKTDTFQFVRTWTELLLCWRSCLCWIQCQIYSVQSVTEVVTLGLLGGWMIEELQAFCESLVSLWRRGIRRAGRPLRACWWAATLWWLLMSGEHPKPLGWELPGWGGLTRWGLLQPSPFFLFFTNHPPSHNGTDQQHILSLNV